MTGLPTVPVDDVIVHPRDNDLILGTHGRSIFIMDDIAALQQLTDKAMSDDVTLFNVRPATMYQNDIYVDRGLPRDKIFKSANPPTGTAISYFLKSPAATNIKVAILDVEGKVVAEMTPSGGKDAGLHRVQWQVGGGGRGGFGGGGGIPGAGGTGAGGSGGSRRSRCCRRRRCWSRSCRGGSPGRRCQRRRRGAGGRGAGPVPRRRRRTRCRRCHRGTRRLSCPAHCGRQGILHPSYGGSRSQCKVSWRSNGFPKKPQHTSRREKSF